jgi:hypothetical protein
MIIGSIIFFITIFSILSIIIAISNIVDKIEMKYRRGTFLPLNKTKKIKYDDYMFGVPDGTSQHTNSSGFSGFSGDNRYPGSSGYRGVSGFSGLSGTSGFSGASSGFSGNPDRPKRPKPLPYDGYTTVY